MPIMEAVIVVVILIIDNVAASKGTSRPKNAVKHGRFGSPGRADPDLLSESLAERRRRRARPAAAWRPRGPCGVGASPRVLWRRTEAAARLATRLAVFLGRFPGALILASICDGSGS